MNGLLMDDAWRFWATAALQLVPRFEKPHDVRIVLDDDSEIPCVCTLKRFEGGMSVWRARPVERFPVERAVGVVVEDMPDFCAGIDLEVPMDCGHADCPGPWAD